MASLVKQALIHFTLLKHLINPDAEVMLSNVFEGGSRQLHFNESVNILNCLLFKYPDTVVVLDVIDELSNNDLKEVILRMETLETGSNKLPS